MIISVDRSTGGAVAHLLCRRPATATVVEIIQPTAPGFGRPLKEQRRVNLNA
jgi:hypothetical protein